MPEPRFHAELNNPDAPTRWWVLDTDNPGMIRAEFPLLPDDVATAEDLAQETARQMNVVHEAQVSRAAQTATVFAWVESLSARELADLAAAVEILGDIGLYAPIRHLAGL